MCKLTLASVDCDEAGIMDKKGPDLFKELLRVYSVAEFEDYFKNGRWNNDLMQADLAMVKLHRREAGAPEPPALEDVKVPELPQETAAPIVPAGVGPAGFGFRPVLPGAMMTPGMRPAMPAARPVAPKATGPAAGGVVAGGAVAELRLIALFVAKWKLEPTKAKTMLAKTSPPRRRYVIQNFKTASSAADATTALEEYLAECEKSGVWDNATGPMAALATAQAPKPAAAVAKIGAYIPGGTAASASVKRPISTVAGAATQGLRPAQPAGGLRPAVVNPLAARATYGIAPAARAEPKTKGSLISNLLNNF